MERENRALLMQLSFVLELPFINFVSKESLAVGYLDMFYRRLSRQCVELTDLINDYDKAHYGQSNVSVGICISAPREDNEVWKCIWIQRETQSGPPASTHSIYYGSEPKV